MGRQGCENRLRLMGLCTWVPCAMAALLASHAVKAQNLVTNGSFQVTGATTSFQFGTIDSAYISRQGGNTSYVAPGTVSGWSTTDGFNFVFVKGSASAGATSMFSTTASPAPFNVYSGSAVANGAVFNYQSPTGGNYIAADGGFPYLHGDAVAPITQSISGLKVGMGYTLSFSWAAAQETGYTGNTTEQWQVSLGGQTDSTQVYSNPSLGFSGWMSATFSYVATSTTELLSFLAVGTPDSQPPMLLLANVTLVPEPASSAVLITGIVGLIGLRRAGGSKKKTAFAAKNAA